MPAVPQTPTICSTVAVPCGGEPPCPIAVAAISRPTAFAPLIGIETIIDFTVDVLEFGLIDADSAANRIVVGADAVYAVIYAATYGAGPPGGTITVRIKVNGITQVTLVHSPSTMVNVLSSIKLKAGDALTVTVQPSFEGASVLSAHLGAVKYCGPPSTEVIVPQG